MPQRFDAFDVDAYLAEHNGGVWSPRMRPGDMLLFHKFTIHGSRTTRGKTGTRYSIEFRAGDVADIPTGYANVTWRI
jgi:ectoine hydroxylase-related dioxygenase (phytanoyl-CoA dioxygenase family)